MRDYDMPHDDPAVVAFLHELTILTRKYKIAIGGCGCCGSPWLFKPDKAELGPDFTYKWTGDFYQGQLEWQNKHDPSL